MPAVYSHNVMFVRKSGTRLWLLKIIRRTHSSPESVDTEVSWLRTSGRYAVELYEIPFKQKGVNSLTSSALSRLHQAA